MKREKIYETKNIVVYAKKPEIGEEAKCADDCIEAAIFCAISFAYNLQTPMKFLRAFAENSTKNIIDSCV